jgi:S-adenosylmethionine:tRNA ribosyltransferase-isomerase
LNLSDFDYEYPQELVAQHPLADRDASRMLVAKRKPGAIEHSHVARLPQSLREGDVLVMNDTKVFHARLFGTRGKGTAIELLVAERHPSIEGAWLCLAKRARRINAGERIFFGMQATAKVLGREGVFLIVEFESDNLELAMKYHGVPPLPPYIERSGYESYSDEDRERYQTIYAKNAGSSAAPTAGLHLSERLINAIDGAGVQIEYITLHVGIDTFAPVRVEDLDEHKMHGEAVTIAEDVAKRLADAKKDNRRIVAVGTTTVRALESAAAEAGKIRHGRWMTDLFITPGYEFRLVDAMMTNFHQPKSTLIILVSAFAGREFILNCYREAIKERYRLFSYGDAMLIL